MGTLWLTDGSREFEIRAEDVDLIARLRNAGFKDRDEPEAEPTEAKGTKGKGKG